LLVPRSTFSATLPNTPPVSGHGYEIDLVHLCVVAISEPSRGTNIFLYTSPPYSNAKSPQEEQAFSCKKLEGLILL